MLLDEYLFQLCASPGCDIVLKFCFNRLVFFVENLGRVVYSVKSCLECEAGGIAGHDEDDDEPG